MPRLIEALGDHHSLAYGHSESPRRFLLESGSGKRWSRGPLHRANLNIGDFETGAGAGFEEFFGGFARRQCARQFGAHSFSVWREKTCCHAPVGFGLEVFDFGLALAYQTHRNALDATGAEGRFDFFPENGRKLEADDAVEHAARLLGVDAVEIDCARILQRFVDCLRGNLVEYDAPRCGRVKSEHLSKMPGYGLTLAVFIARKPDRLCLLCGFAQVADNVFLVFGNLVDGFEISLLVDRDVAFAQIAYMAYAGHYLEIFSEETLDSLGLLRRLYNYQVLHLQHCWTSVVESRCRGTSLRPLPPGGGAASRVKGECYSFMLWKTFWTSSSSSNFSRSFSIFSRCSSVTSLRSLGMRSNSAEIISKPCSSRYF
ncbi:flagellar basal body rod protein [Prevotella sp. CAG:1031]|nr:flagellar basal body rod protein [Prevotella sp. CAG:1031]